MYRKTFLVLLLGWISMGTAFAGGGVVSVVKKVGRFLDTMAVSGVDQNYIVAPRRPWQIIARGNVNQSDLKLKSTIHNTEDAIFFMKGDSHWAPRIKTAPSTYVGVWGGYRGYGLGYSWNVGGDKGRILTFGATGGSYGVNLRIHWFENDEPELSADGTLLDISDAGVNYVPFRFSEVAETESPFKTRALFLDGYYLFNGKRCSYAAAYDQSVIQKRSAGSLMAGAMYFHQTTHYDEPENADIIFFMNDVGRFKTWQVSAGVGYIYNWVPAKGLLVSAMAIPMVTFYNHTKVWRYDSDLKDRLLDPENGVSFLSDLIDGTDNFKGGLREAAVDPVISNNSRVTVNVDARLSLTYQWSRYFINAYGQFMSFRYQMDDLSGRLNDWYVYASAGVRL